MCRRQASRRSPQRPLQSGMARRFVPSWKEGAQPRVVGQAKPTPYHRCATARSITHGQAISSALRRRGAGGLLVPFSRNPVAHPGSTPGTAGQLARRSHRRAARSHRLLHQKSAHPRRPHHRPPAWRAARCTSKRRTLGSAISGAAACLSASSVNATASTAARASWTALCWPTAKRE